MNDTLDIVPFPPVTSADAVAAGYAEFNRNPHLCIDIPDGGFTISVKTSEGKRVTFAFQPYRTGGPPQCVDIAYHDNGTFDNFNKVDLPTFDVILFGRSEGRKDRQIINTREQDGAHKPGIACVLLGPSS